MDSFHSVLKSVRKVVRYYFNLCMSRRHWFFRKPTHEKTLLAQDGSRPWWEGSQVLGKVTVDSFALYWRK